ncbi:MAG: RNA-splicing ligase RtcB, partial [Acidimicrobiia bacterium]
MKLEAAGEYRYEVAPEGKMRVPAVIFASPELIPDIVNDKSIEQAANVATLPGIVRASFAMPDIHWGYGFPIGGV